MTGSELLKLLLMTDQYTEVTSFSRKATGLSHPKFTEHIIDFDKPEKWQNLVKGDVLFSCLGTTLKKAGSKEAQRKIDFEYQYEFAKAGLNNGVATHVLISSAGASVKSPFFYSRIKGELDEAVQILGFKNSIIFRPAQLYGNRVEKRIAEKSALKFMFFLNALGLLKKYKPIHAEELARAMIKAANLNISATYTMDEIFRLYHS